MALQDLLEEERQRRAAGGGMQGTGGVEQSIGAMLPYLQGQTRGYDYSGMGRQAAQDYYGKIGMQGQGPGGGPQGQGQANGWGPGGRHAQRMGVDFPGFQNQNPVGGMNMAPGAENMQAIDQMAAQGPPPWAQALGQQGGGPPGQLRQMAAGGGGRPPQSQGWRNFAPGSGGAAELGYGTQEFGQKYGFGGAAAGQGTIRNAAGGIGAPGGAGIREMPQGKLGPGGAGYGGGRGQIGNIRGGPGGVGGAPGPGPGGAGGGGPGGGGGGGAVGGAGGGPGSGGGQGGGGKGGGGTGNGGGGGKNSPGQAQVAAHADPSGGTAGSAGVYQGPSTEQQRRAAAPSASSFAPDPRGSGLGQPNRPPRRNTGSRPFQRGQR